MRTSVLVAGMTAALAAPAPEQSLFKEGFDDGNRDGWYLTSGGAVSVADDSAGIGSGNALFLATHAGSSQRRLLANFKPVELTKAGDAIVLRFDYRITGSADAVRGRGDAEGGFRFGLFDSRGPLQTADAAIGTSSANADDDVGYLAMTSVGARNRARLVEEKAEDQYFMGGPDLQFHHTDDNFGGTNDSLKHSAVFTIRRVSGTAVSLELLVDGKKSIRAELSDAPRTRFDTVGFAASHRAADFAVDNVEVTSGTSPASTSVDRALTVRARCEPCTIEIGKDTTVTADTPDPGGRPLTYKWSAPTGKFADPTARQTSWTAPMRRGWTEERWKGGGGVPITVTVDDGRGGTASDTVTVEVSRPAVK